MSDLGSQHESVAASSSHRLGSTLFLAVLIHGVVILGVTFSVAPSNTTSETPALKVTLLAKSDSAAGAQDDAEYLANRDETGGSPVDLIDDFRPTNVPSADQRVNAEGDPSGTDLVDGMPQQPSQATERLATRAAANHAVPADARVVENVADAPKRATAMIDLFEIQTLAAEFDTQARLPESERDASERASPSARASILAGYLDAWRQRVELVGTLNFPNQFLSGSRAHRRPTLEVAIDADGSLADVVVQNSSGDHAVDQAAISILRMAAPFEPFPEPISTEYETLRFAYDWDFIDGNGAKTP